MNDIYPQLLRQTLTFVYTVSLSFENNTRWPMRERVLMQLSFFLSADADDIS